MSVSDAMATLKLYIDLANSERAAIWSRNAAMLVGNSFIINAINSDAARASIALHLVFSFAGLIICVLWAIMTWNGWGWFYSYMRAANQLSLPLEMNPFAKLANILRRKDTIFVCTMLVIATFGMVYIVSLVHFCTIDRCLTRFSAALGI